jgi:nitrilase
VPGRDKLYHDEADWLARGNSVVVGPEGEVLAGPLVESCGLVVADVDTAAVRQARMRFDPVGHYARAEVLRLVVDRRRLDAVRFVDVLEADEAPV